MSESTIPTDQPLWVRLMKATVYTALGLTIPLAWGVTALVLNTHTESGTSQAAEAFNIVGNFMGIAGVMCFVLVTVEIIGPHYVTWKINKLASELWAYLSGVTSG